MLIKKLSTIVIILLIIIPLSSCTRSEYKNKKPNILFLMLDTLRADHLSGYGYERETSPVLDRFASENLKFSNAISAAPWTPASVATMFTGLYPASHGMVPPNDREIAKKGMAKLNPNILTIAEFLKSQGYKTAGVSPNPWITKEFGFTQGFDEFYYIARQKAEKITESGEEILTAWRDSKNTDPFFLYLHYLDPHDPYKPPPPYDSMFTGELKKSPFKYDEKMMGLINQYDGEIRYMDTHLGRLFEILKAMGLYDDLFIIIVSDHGEQFMEHGNLRHGYKLYNEEIHVPLILKTGRAKDKGRIINQTVSTIDIFPTILSRMGEKIPKNMQGKSLLNDEELEKRAAVLSEITRIYDLKSATDLKGKRIILEVEYDQKKFDPTLNLEAWTNPTISGVYDTRNDYGCYTKIDDPVLEDELKTTFDDIFATALKKRVAISSEGNEEIKDELLDQLKSLGYLQ